MKDRHNGHLLYDFIYMKCQAICQAKQIDGAWKRGKQGMPANKLEYPPLMRSMCSLIEVMTAQLTLPILKHASEGQRDSSVDKDAMEPYYPRSILGPTWWKEHQLPEVVLCPPCVHLWNKQSSQSVNKLKNTLYVIKINLNGASHAIKLQFNNEKLKEEKNYSPNHKQNKPSLNIQDKIIQSVCLDGRMVFKENQCPNKQSELLSYMYLKQAQAYPSKPWKNNKKLS